MWICVGRCMKTTQSSINWYPWSSDDKGNGTLLLSACVQIATVGWQGCSSNIYTSVWKWSCNWSIELVEHSKGHHLYSRIPPSFLHAPGWRLSQFLWLLHLLQVVSVFSFFLQVTENPLQPNIELPSLTKLKVPVLTCSGLPQFLTLFPLPASRPPLLQRVGWGRRRKAMMPVPSERAG